MKEKKVKASNNGYIGRPKAMKTTNKFEFKNLTKQFYIELGIFLVIAAFIAYIVIRLVNVGNVPSTKIMTYEYIGNDETPHYIMENEFIRFDMDPSTTAFSVLQKNTGKVWYSNPLDVDNDKLALSKEKNNMKSTFLIKYSNINGVDNVYDSYSYSIQKKYYEVKSDTNEITVNYSIGDVERVYIYPMALTEADMESYCEKLSTADARSVKQSYRKMDITNLLPSDNVSELLAKYPMMEKEIIYIIRDPLQTWLKEKTESLFESIGYTEKDYEKDLEMYKEGSVKNVPMFNLTVNYKLDGNQFIVDIPFDKISYKKEYPIISVSVLPYFGAAGTTDNGYLFVPEGSGSLIKFNNGKTKQSGYYSNVYGWDYATDRLAVFTETRNSYPVFGISYDDSSLISIIDKGSSYASISADISGKKSSCNFAYAEYTMLNRELFEVSARNINAQYSYQDSLPQDESISQIYKFVDSGSYVDMANAYGDYLFDDNKKVNNENVPVAVEIIGAVDKVQQVVGIPMNKPYKLTTYKEASKIITDIENRGVKNAYVKLTGMINGGYKQKLLEKFNFIGILGGKSDFKKMISTVKDLSSVLYLDAETQFEYNSNIFDGFFNYSDAARFVSSELAELYVYSPIWYGKDETTDSYYLLKTSVAAKANDILLNKSLKYQLDGISYRSNGYILSSDFNKNSIMSRSKVMMDQIQKMKNVNTSGLGLMVNAGNDYSVNEAEIITNMVLHGNSYAILDKQIPFYQIALHGRLNYTGTAINNAPEYNQVVLESAECGAGLFFTFINDSEQTLQETRYTNYYASSYDNWKDKMTDIYTRYNKELSVIKNQKISDHSFMSENVTVTKYDNNYQVVVNFGYTDYVTQDGVVIPARDYKVIKVEA